MLRVFLLSMWLNWVNLKVSRLSLSLAVKSFTRLERRLLLVELDFLRPGFLLTGGQICSFCLALGVG